MRILLVVHFSSSKLTQMQTMQAHKAAARSSARPAFRASSATRMPLRCRAQAQRTEDAQVQHTFGSLFSARLHAVAFLTHSLSRRNILSSNFFRNARCRWPLRLLSRSPSRRCVLTTMLAVRCRIEIVIYHCNDTQIYMLHCANFRVVHCVLASHALGASRANTVHCAALSTQTSL